MSSTSVPASIALTDPTIAVTVVASVFLALFIAIFVFIAIAPVVSDHWQAQLGGPETESAASEPATAD